MAKSMYNLNPVDYYRNGSRRPGATCNKVYSPIPDDDVSKTDRNNRIIVTKTMVQYVEKGVKPERAAMMIANNPKVKKAFEYLTKAGVDLKELFVHFYTTEVNRTKEDTDITR